MRSFLQLSLILCIAVACESAPHKRDLSDRVDPLSTIKPDWTRAFLKEAVLLADVIRIEGPFDLLEHLAVRQDPSVAAYHTETTRDGLLQITTLREDAVGAQIKAVLDRWEVCALARMEVLERKSDDPVRVIALGNAYFATPDGDEQRGERLEFRGERGR
jgi:hypothetical protein